MARKKRTLRAIDLYSGVGGWSLGLRLAGIEVVGSYERWGAANETNFKNNRHQTQTIDIRRLSPSELPKGIDIVVGSPPCTQFSFSNRGGSGDISDGLQDIAKFLSIVSYLRPSMWAMENVPRVAKIIEKELRKGGRLEKFRNLEFSTRVINMEDFGLPQRRHRCIVGNLDFDLLAEYAKQTPERTLGMVVSAIASRPAVDPLFGLTVTPSELKDHVIEDVLSDEEIRINRAAKALHPVYNSMIFPDSLERSVRTLTATCTRVSRESIVIRMPGASTKYRRLTIRERASLQGFPITFQFYGNSYSQKVRMIGNAIPPAFTYYVGEAFKGTKASKVPSLSDHYEKLVSPVPSPPVTVPDRAGGKFPVMRRFWFAIPSLRLKSGVRFELKNFTQSGKAQWHVAFYFGTSKSIHSLRLDQSLHTQLIKRLPIKIEQKLRPHLAQLSMSLKVADITRMQSVWSHRGAGGTAPFVLLDQLDEVGLNVKSLLAEHAEIALAIVEHAIEAEYEDQISELAGVAKLFRHAPLILAGLLTGSVANIELDKKQVLKTGRLKKLVA